MKPEIFEDYLEMARNLLAKQDSQSDLTEANQYVNAALQHKPDDRNAWILKSQILSAMQDDPAALACIEWVLRSHPHHAETLFIRSAILADMQHYEEALQSIELTFQCLTPSDAWLTEDLFFEKAAILDALDRSEEAENIFKIGLNCYPHSDLLRAGLEPLQREKMRKVLRVIDGGL